MKIGTTGLKVVNHGWPSICPWLILSSLNWNGSGTKSQRKWTEQKERVRETRNEKIIHNHSWAKECHHSLMCIWSWACCVSHLHLQWSTLVDDDHQIRVHGDHQEEISSGDWSRSSIHQIWHWLPPQYATVVIWSNLPDRQTCKTMSKLTQTKRLKKTRFIPWSYIFTHLVLDISSPSSP